jgi:hypothetical protein
VMVMVGLKENDVLDSISTSPSAQV